MATNKLPRGLNRLLPSVGFFVVRKHLGNVFWAPLSGAMWTAGRDGSSQWRTRRQQRGAQRVGTQRRLLQGRSESIHPRGSVREDPSETIRPRGSAREDPRARARGTQVELRWNSGGTQVGGSEAGQRRVRGGTEWESDGSRMEVGWKSDGSRMEVGWKSDGAHVELRWNSGGTQVGGPEAGQRRVRGGSTADPCKSPFPPVDSPSSSSRVKLAG